MNKIEYDPFVNRQFSPGFSGTKVDLEIKDKQLEVINDTYINGDSKQLLNSDWNFCK